MNAKYRKPCPIVIDGVQCNRPSSSGGICQAHVAQKRQHGEYRAIRHVVPSGSTAKRDSRGRKKCKYCQEWRKESDYYSATNTSDNLQPKCKDCYRWGNLVRRFGVDKETYLALLLKQGGCCAVCAKQAEGYLSVDHDHSCCSGIKTCGKCVRGLLCSACNGSLGLVGDSPEILQNMITYLRDWNQR